MANGLTKLQNAPITVPPDPIDIEFACEQVRLKLAALPWIDFPYFIAQRFVRRDANRGFVYPEIYSRDTNTPEEKYPYHRLTPDGDYKGMFFFYANEMSINQFDYLQYNVAVIFSVNLANIDNVRLQDGLFTQHLIRDARRILRGGLYGLDFNVETIRETRDLQTVFREFVLDDVEQYNRAPLQCFRFDLLITILEQCP